MAVDPRIRSYIDTRLLPVLDEELFAAQFEIILLDILQLLHSRPGDAPHTMAYLAYRVSFLYMRSQNEALQGRRGASIGAVLHRIYNHRTPIADISQAAPADSFPVLLLLYQLHHALILNGLRAEGGLEQHDPFEALRLLQVIIGAAHGPWQTRLRLQGGVGDYHHARLASDDGSLRIEIGRARRDTPLNLHLSTWNMQGSSESTDSKWRTAVLQLARANHVVMIQEAGVVPASARLTRRHAVADQFGQMHDIDQYLWQAGTSTRPEWYDVFFFDVQRLRVNLAIVVAQSAGLDLLGVRVVSDGLLSPEGAPDYRPALGLRLRHAAGAGSGAEEVLVYNFHAISGGGPNAPRMLREISWHTASPYVLLGDFNRAPAPAGTAVSRDNSWVSPPHLARIEPAASNTHPATAPAAMLDYAVINGSTEPVAPGQVGLPCPSDHLSVSYAIRFI